MPVHAAERDIADMSAATMANTSDVKMVRIFIKESKKIKPSYTETSLYGKSDENIGLSQDSLKTDLIDKLIV